MRPQKLRRLTSRILEIQTTKIPRLRRAARPRLPDSALVGA
jgi:hypothetical protein